MNNFQWHLPIHIFLFVSVSYIQGEWNVFFLNGKKNTGSRTINEVKQCQVTSRPRGLTAWEYQISCKLGSARGAMGNGWKLAI